MRNALPKIILIMLVNLLLLLNVANAQNTPVINVALPTVTNNLPHDLFAEFEAHYGVRVVLESALTEVYLTPPSANIEDHLTELQAYAQSADVVYVDSYTIDAVSVQSGFLLDLQPLVSSDVALNPNDYHPAAWQSYQWDGQMWALPIAFDPIVLAYNPAAFDVASLSYPSPNWTIDDYVNAIRALTQKDGNGNVLQPGYEQSAYDMHLLTALANASLVDTTQFPSVPNFNQPTLSQVMTTWQQLYNEGIVGQATDNMANVINTMSVMRSSSLFGTSAQVALLPNNHAGIATGAFAVSAGTANPEIAYQLAQYITTQQVLFDALYSTYPANQTLIPNPNLPQHLQPILDQAVGIAQPQHLMRYSNYAESAISSDGDIVSNLLNVQQQAIADLQTARTIGENTTVVVEDSFFSGDGMVLNFGVMTTIAPLPNQVEWDRLAADFARQQADIAGISVEAAFVSSIDEFSTSYDCYLTTFNPLNTMDTSLILPVEPLMSQDATLIPNDFVTSTIDAVRLDGMTLAYPLSIQPRLLQFDSVQMGNAGIIVDNQQWTVNQFTDAATQWQRSTNTAFYSIDQSLNMMTLIASFGGMPIDFSTTPPTPNFTAPENVTAIQQVLDMARNGQIAYSELLAPPSMGNSPTTPLLTATFNTMLSSQLVNNAQLRHYPAGSQYHPVVYNLAVGFISRQTQDAGACYQWLSYIAQQGTLFDSMPVRRSVLQNPNTQAALGNERTQLYLAYEAVLQQPNTVRIPRVNAIGLSDTFVLQYLFNMATDAYVLQGVDLQSALRQSQNNAEVYLQCRETGTSVAGCALGVAPDIQSVLR